MSTETPKLSNCKKLNRLKTECTLRIVAGSLVRKNADSLSEQEILTLQTVLKKLEDDHTEHGFQALAAYHAEPSQCRMKDGRLIACCTHGMPTFSHWHRAYVVQFEQALVEKGLANIGVPYWDWTQPITELPELVRHQIYRDPTGGVGQKNSWFSADIEHGDVHTHTARAVDDRLYEHVAPGGKTHLFSMMLDALEQEEYCHFEVNVRGVCLSLRLSVSLAEHHITPNHIKPRTRHHS
ncbi:hemocyanin type 2 unit a-like [Babylonia areolata]|uniref:hemocyanin type 2 unit a-like n=1 Tax=Babylonia areolata TaxID=304850 RepID=UPI003FD330A7